jgi:hypothetical protein
VAKTVRVCIGAPSERLGSSRFTLQECTLKAVSSAALTTWCPPTHRPCQLCAGRALILYRWPGNPWCSWLLPLLQVRRLRACLSLGT